jgi:hypothetical protein
MDEYGTSIQGGIHRCSVLFGVSCFGKTQAGEPKSPLTIGLSVPFIGIGRSSRQGGYLFNAMPCWPGIRAYRPHFREVRSHPCRIDAGTDGNGKSTASSRVEVLYSSSESRFYIGSNVHAQVRDREKEMDEVNAVCAAIMEDPGYVRELCEHAIMNTEKRYGVPETNQRK